MRLNAFLGRQRQGDSRGAEGKKGPDYLDRDKLKEPTIAAVSHDMRSPLATIVAAVEMLTEHVPEGSPERFLLSTILRQTAHLGRLIDDLSDLSLLSAGQASVALRRVEISELVIQARDEALLHERREILVEGASEPHWALADSDKVRRILHNLLGNALKYSRSGTPITIRVLPEPEGQLQLEVEDMGGGPIPGDLQPALFEPFTRLRHDQHGMGLGLYIVRQFALAMGGTAWVHTEGNRCCFGVTLKLCPEADQDEISSL